MIQKNSVQAVIDATDVIDVVGNFVSLKKRGANYLGLCPFHGEKTPSFTVSPAKGIYKCFGCGRAGNGVSFIQEHEKLSFVEAIRWLAKRYQIELEETAMSDEAKLVIKEEESLRIVNDFAASYFSKTLLESEEGRNIGLSYFEERGFRKETIEKFQLGYSLEKRDSFLTEALEKSYQKNILLGAECK